MMQNILSHPVPLLVGVLFFEAAYTVGPEIYVSPRPFSSLTMRESGRITVTTDGRTLTSDADSLTFIPQGCGYRTRILEAGSMRILHFFTQDGTPDFAQVPMTLHPDAPLAFHNRFSVAVAQYANAGCDCAVMAEAYRLLSDASAVFFRRPTDIPPRIARCRTFIDENLADAGLRISTLADMAEISEVYFRREFARYYGISPLAYIKKRRMDLACHLLSTGFYTVTEVALRSGFDSISYFSAEFRRMNGVTPAEYRQKFGNV